jgi:hypothetical protein
VGGGGRNDPSLVCTYEQKKEKENTRCTIKKRKKKEILKIK